MKKGKVRIGIGVWIMAVAVAVETWHSGEDVVRLLFVAAAMGLHEAGHWLAARWCGVKVRSLRLDVLGARMELEGVMSYGREFLVAAGGPLANGLSVAVVWPWWLVRGGCMEDDLLLFLMASVVLGGINLLPVRTLDGGRMLSCFLCRVAGVRTADIVLQMTGLLCLGALWLAAAYVLLVAGQMLSLFVFSLVLVLRMMTREHTPTI